MADHSATRPHQVVNALVEFRALYEETIQRVVAWSEGVVLEPQYMHLHESDIGTERGYELGEYLLAFINSLGSVAKRIRRIVFCYSYESSEPLRPAYDPTDCTHERFYSYELFLSEDRSVRKADIRWSGGDVASKPLRPQDHHPLSALNDVLSGCQWVQPYMLRYVGGKVDAQFALALSTRDLVNTFCEWHSMPGSYQFSIYGYDVGDMELSKAEQLLLHLAFLVHIWTWNHDLRTAHLVRRVALDDLPRGRELWSQLSAEMEALLERLRDLHVTKDEHAASVIAVHRDTVDELFKEPHDLSTWNPDSFAGFLAKARLHRALLEFLAYCGWGDVTNVDLRTKTDRTCARASWLATKYLTRCALDASTEVYRKLSFDQIVLAALVGLHQAGVEGLPVAVVRTLELPAEAAAPDVPSALVAFHLAFQDASHNWENSEVEVNVEGTTEGPRAIATWDYSGTTGAYLPAFLRSGMLAMQMAQPSLHVFPMPARAAISTPPPSGVFLVVVAQLIRALAKPTAGPDRLARPTKVVAEMRTRQYTNGISNYRAKLRVELDRPLPPQATFGTGQKTGPLTKLAEWCGRGAPVRVESAVDSDSWNCFVVNRQGTCEILLTFGEGNAQC